MRLMFVKTPWLLLPALMLLAGCTNSSHPREAANAPTPAATAVAGGALAACAKFVPGSQHSTVTTVAAVRSVRIGMGGIQRGLHFAEGMSGPGDVAFFCYRFRATAHVDEWWATTSEGQAVRLGGVGGVNHDVGVFDAAWFD